MAFVLSHVVYAMTVIVASGLIYKSLILAGVFTFASVRPSVGQLLFVFTIAIAWGGLGYVAVWFTARWYEAQKEREGENIGFTRT